MTRLRYVWMKNVLILIHLLNSLDGKLTTNYACQNCVGKIHTKNDLALAKQPLILSKNHICQNNKQYKFIIIVKSGDFQRRNFTRSTWAKEIIEQFNIPVLYAVGYPKNSSHQKEIIFEDIKHNDLLEFDIIDSYYNLTIKTTSVLFWYKKYCSNSSDYLLYVDDDVLIHVDKLIMYMNRINNNQSIEGWFEKSGKIQRKGLGGVIKEDFPIDLVPDYLWGAAVLYPSNIISNVLIETIFNTKLPIFFRDDVFINGFIAQEAGIKREYMNGLLLYDPTEDDLKTNMIIVDFKNESNREKAWKCYKYNVECNKDLFEIFFKILCGICVLIIIIIFCGGYFRTTKLYYQLKYEFNHCYYGLASTYIKAMDSRSGKNKRSTIGIQQAKLGCYWLIHLGRMSTRVLPIFVIILLFYLVKNKYFRFGSSL